ncbi:MAG: nucleotidyltransferase family protein, partial [Chloroflexi bacterium]|nr:nucleotidyltransferase family protein [Chloroflexota bacterium]
MKEEIEEEIKSLIHQDIDWDYLLQISAKHRLTPLLYWQLNSVCFDSVPPEIMERLKTYFNENARRNLLFMGELQRILNLFEDQGIMAIPYKGPILATQAYGNLVFREFSDLDIFIQKKDFLKVKELLLANDFDTQFRLEGSQERKYLQSQREYKFINSETNINLEIHWNFTGLSFSGDWNYFLNEQNYQQTKTGIFNLKPEDMFLVLCIHASG